MIRIASLDRFFYFTNLEHGAEFLAIRHTVKKPGKKKTILRGRKTLSLACSFLSHIVHNFGSIINSLFKETFNLYDANHIEVLRMGGKNND